MRTEIRHLLRLIGWSQTRLAKVSAVPQPTVNLFLNGKRRVSEERLERLVKALFDEVKRNRLEKEAQIAENREALVALLKTYSRGING